ncbi:MAG: putative bifunctional diguanylate cyclase/phosphodiesterase, partial [Microcystaceae cyanobacterium]
DILRDASIAVFQAKRNGKNSYQVMTSDLQSPAIRKLQIITELKQALKAQEFRIYFQPIMSLKNGQLAGFETLIRWQHPERGLVFPGEFIAIAEESGLILEIDLWVLEAVCQQLQQWQQQFKITVPLMLSLNFSPLAVKQGDTLERVKKPLKDINFKPWQLKLEVTETAFMDTFGSHCELLKNLQSLGLEFCLDDFGTGHSSLSRLQQLPVHTLKIDRSFVLQLESEKTGVTVIKTIINLAHDLGMSVVVEGIETESQEQTLKRLGCDYAQGFFFAKPLPIFEATNFLRKYFVEKISDHRDKSPSP